MESPILWTRTLHVLAALWLTAGVFASAVVFTVLVALQMALDPRPRAARGGDERECRMQATR